MDWNFCNLSDTLISEFDALNTFLTDTFEVSKLQKFHTIQEVNENIFCEGISEEIELLSKSNDKIKETFKEASKVFSKMVDDTKYTKGDSVVKCDFDDAKGVELYCTLNRGKKLFGSLKGTIIVKLDDEKIPRKDFRIVNNKKSFIVHSYLSKLSSQYIGNCGHLKKLIEEKYNELMDIVYNSYNKTMDSISQVVSELDMVSTNAMCAVNNGYYRPTIVEKKVSFLRAKKLRHPIVEQLQCNQSQPYIDNDVTLDSQTKGMLLFGTNACGKSTLMKAVGLSLIMAQCGMFVPATDFEFMPYTHFFTRILGNDNIYRGLSSFAVEMTELRSILKRTDHRGLVLGDEVCNGTESISALAIVTAALQRLDEKGSNFIFATHLHELTKMPEINSIKTLKKYHLKISREENRLIYERKLAPGSGPAIYGLEVARAMDLDSEFITNANEILLRITRGTTNILDPRMSHFNTNVVVSQCMVCDEKAEETHHIQEQHTADQNNMIGHIHKNRQSNLVPLCKECHLKVHHRHLEIKGYKMSSEGIYLDFKQN